MSEWKTYKLGEITVIKNGKSRPNEKGNIPVYGGNGILDYTNRHNTDNETIIIGRVGAYCGSVFFENKPLWISDNAMFTNSKETTSSKFLYYLLKDKNLNKYAQGSSHPLLTQGFLNDLEISFPDLATQTQIAQILTSLDDKIELNLQMNQTLEAMAQALFKEWCYVEEGIIPKGWTWKKLLDIADVSSSKRIFRDEYILNGVPFYRGKEVTQLSNGEAISTELFISEERYTEIKEKFGVPQIGDILITSVGTIGSVWLVDNDAPFYFKDGNVTWIKDYKTAINGEFVHQWLQTNEAKEQIKSVTIGSTQQALTISALRGLNILIPDNETVTKICIQLEKINVKRNYNLTQIQTLTQTRDTLLPKLMSGKIEIKN
jgi:type I restriction enzyme, S subunit